MMMDNIKWMIMSLEMIVISQNKSILKMIMLCTNMIGIVEVLNIIWTQVGTLS